MTTALALRKVAIIGFGEAGGILGAELVQRGLPVATYDILFDDPARRAAMQEKARAAGVAAAASAGEAVTGADLILSTVTAASSVAAAEGVAPHLGAGQVFLDLNSVSPDAKRRSARAVESSGADYVEAAVMAAVPPKRLAVPMLLGGRRAAAVAEVLAPLGCDVSVVADRIGVASAIKMCRSVMIKGLEALTVECLMGARRYGAEAEVLASLHGTFPSMGWTGDLPNYLISRVAEHGRRRAAEMREVTATLTDGGIEPRMAPATALLHEWFVQALAEVGQPYGANGSFDWRKAVDALLARSDAAEGKTGTAESALAPR